MNSLDLDDLRQRWSAAQQRIHSTLHFDAEAVMGVLVQRRTSAFRRHARRLLLGLAGTGAVVLGLFAFALQHLHDALYLLCALPLLALFSAEWIMDLGQWQALRRIDFAAPVAAIDAGLDRLRARRLRVARWFMLTSVLLWWPAVAVFFKGVFGADLVRGLPDSFWWINLCLGVLFMPVSSLVVEWIAHRFGARPGFQRFLDELAGSSWARARRALDAQHGFGQAVESGSTDATLRQLAQGSLAPAAANGVLHQLRWRNGLGIAFSSLAMLLLAAFSASHGGQWWFIVPSIGLNLFCVPQLVMAIMQLKRLRTQDYGLPPAQLRADFDSLARTRACVARISLAAAPLVLLLLAQVLGRVGFGINVLAWLGWPFTACFIVLALVSGSVLMRSRKAVDWAGLGTVTRLRELAGILGR